MEEAAFQFYTHAPHALTPSRPSCCQDVMMITASHKIIRFSLLFLSLSWVVAATAIPLPAVETLVEFSPEADSPPCRGVQISKDLMVTSPACAEKAREFSNFGLIEILTLSGESLGYITEQPDKSPEGSMLLNISLDSETFRPASYPAFYNISPVPEQALTYNFDEKHQLVQQPVNLTTDETQKSKFIISTESPIPQGSPIFDLKGQLVCLSGTSGQCFTVSDLPIARFRRGLKDDPDDPDGEGAGISNVEALGIVAGIGVAIAGTAAAIFYLATYLKARSMGMPANVFWVGILSLQYCGHCNSNSALYAIIGLFFCPVCFCPLSAYHAASNWIEDYAGSHAERAPIIHQPHPSVPSIN